MTDIVVRLEDKGKLIHYPAFLMEAYLEGGCAQKRVEEALYAAFNRIPDDMIDVKDMGRTLVTEKWEPLPLFEEFIAYLTVNHPPAPESESRVMVVLSDTDNFPTEPTVAA